MKPLRKTTREMLVVAFFAFFALLLTAIPSLAQITGPCADCHTMHNSQDGVEMATTWDKSVAGPFDRLLKRNGCLGCHRGIYDSTSLDRLDRIPKVWDDTLASTYPGAGCSAGGNFAWVSSGADADDAKGHNVVSVVGVDHIFSDNVPPGFDDSFTGTGLVPRGPFSTADGEQLSCSGTFGCHGDPDIDGDYASLAGAHHGVDNLNGFSDGLTLASSFRFLYGIRGVEDPEWEYSVTAAVHNQYHAVDRANNLDVDNQTITHLCCECHGNYHAALMDDAGNYGSPWVRHPTDFDMYELDAASEYKKYNVASTVVGQYSPLAPVGSDMSALALDTESVANVQLEVISAIFAADNQAIVTCISCHRAHGSEFDDLLRWNYTAASAHAASGNASGSGCFVCHTEKDDNI